VGSPIDKVCSRCGIVHFSLETEVDGDLVHFQILVAKWPCTKPVVRERPRLADMLVTALVSEAAA
jgi:hypothetical protein